MKLIHALIYTTKYSIAINYSIVGRLVEQKHQQKTILQMFGRHKVKVCILDGNWKCSSICRLEPTYFVCIYHISPHAIIICATI